MYLVALAWLYVALMMAVAEATHSNGTLLGAVFTFLLYGLAPVALVMYVLGTPARRTARRRTQAQAASSAVEPADATRSKPLDPDGSSHAPAVAVPGPVPPVGEEA